MPKRLIVALLLLAAGAVPALAQPRPPGPPPGGPQPPGMPQGMPPGMPQPPPMPQLPQLPQPPGPPGRATMACGEGFLFETLQPAEALQRIGGKCQPGDTIAIPAAQAIAVIGICDFNRTIAVGPRYVFCAVAPEVVRPTR